MREIKFRAWDEIKEKMFYFVQVTSYKDGSCGIDIGNRYSDLYSPRKVNLMQYTGIKDINEKEIYEGDIVQITYNGRFLNRVVKWNNKTTKFICCSGNYEVIGNIYENPELLNEE